MKVSGKSLCILLVACTLIGLVYAESSWRIISNIFKGQTEVSKAELLSIYPDASTPFPTVTITGQPVKVIIDVENPNPVTINGWIMVNFTKTGIALDDVSVMTSALYKNYQTSISKVGVYGATLVFTIKVGYAFDPYFNFNSGLNDDITYFNVQYNTQGTYDWALAVYQ